MNPQAKPRSRRRKWLRNLAVIAIGFFLLVLVLVKTVLFSSGDFALPVADPLPSGRVVPQLATDGERAALIAPDGSLWAWGGTESKLIGLADEPTQTETPIRVGTDLDWAQIALGTVHTAALKTNGTLWFWGRHARSHLPGAHGMSGTNPLTVAIPTQLGTVTNWIHVSAGASHTVALKADGSLWAVGLNFAGQIGNGTTNDQEKLTLVTPDKDWQFAAASLGNTFAIKTNGTLWAWGSDPTPAEIDVLSPVQIDPSTNWVQVVPSAFTFFALKSDGSLWVGGHNSRFIGGAFGATPGTVTRFGADSDWNHIYVGEGHFFARKKDGSWWICGDNSWGELGVGGSFGILKRQVIPQVERLPFQMEPWAFCTSPELPTTIVLLKDGSLWSWGAQLGAPNPSTRFRQWKLRFNQVLYHLSGKNGFTLQREAISAVPRKIWELPPFVQEP